jgi:ribosomal protein S12 methylthiotransferase
MNPKNNKITVGFVALGCPKNIVDSERMLAQIAQAGFIITDDTNNADVIVINTCGFIAPAKAEAMEAIQNAISRKQKGRVRKVIVAGCLPQRLGKELLSEADKIDAILGLEHRDNIAKIIEKTLTTDTSAHFLTPTYKSLFDDRARLRITPPHSAYLRINEGCSRKCSFCTIPAIRGKNRSKPKWLVIAEAEELVKSGAVELNIIGQDITAYGRDLENQNNLPDLLSELAKVPQLRWIRLLYLYPSGIDKRLIETVAGCEKIVHYFDIPIQHINPQILRQMRRPHSKDRIYRLIENLRTKLPDCTIRTTLIVGFPGETEARFNELLKFVRWARFDHLGCFTFYAEKGTPAAEFPRQIPEHIKQQRLKELMLTQQQIVSEKNKTRIGSKLTCLIDSIEKGRPAKGRFFGQAPEIDSVCIIKKCSASPGDFVNTKVTGTRGYDLLCEQI